ncbi:MAG: hypothetical protein A2X46_13055 [Lentisphaerae bacterium GWF2_57_35]|nr:MAG: hypothetical protein A2X46_13055 [Lentisphaerae bacterium GWF2_57_35]
MNRVFRAGKDKSIMKTWIPLVWVLFLALNAAAQTPQSFSLTNPANQAVYIGINTSIQWQASANATGYEVYWGTNESPAFAAQTNGTEYVLSGLESNAIYYWYVVATNDQGSLRTPAAGAWSFKTVWNYDTQLSSKITIDADNFSYDNKSILVNATTVTVNGAHSFDNIYLVRGAKLTHSACTTNNEYFMDLTIANELFIDVECAIDVSSNGYRRGRTLGNLVNTNLGEYTGGSYGGFGGKGLANGLRSPVYGDFRYPNELGSGAATNVAGGSGGGLARIAAAQVNVDGRIVANGGNYDVYSNSGGGSGGGLYICTELLSGQGTISANGGAAGYGSPFMGGGGGGGRIAVYYTTNRNFDLETQVTAYGGFGRITDGGGGAGTIYLKQLDQPGELIVNSFNISTNGLTPIWIPDHTNYYEHISIKGTGQVVYILADNVIPSNLVLSSGAELSHPPCTSNAEYKLNLVVSGLLAVETNGCINANGRGYLEGRTFGNTTVSASTYQCGGSYGGLGGTIGLTGRVNETYGDFKSPHEYGSGGAKGHESDGPFGPGGGLIHITANELELNGVLSANGGSCGGNSYNSGGSGGAIFVDAGVLRGDGRVDANGGNGSSTNRSSGGGGGRVAVYCASMQGASVLDHVQLSGGIGKSNGAPGTIYYTNHVAPVRIESITPTGRVVGTVHQLQLVFLTPLRDHTLYPDDIQILDPDSNLVAVSEIAAVTPFKYIVAVSTSIVAAGTYKVGIQTNVVTWLGGASEAVHEHFFWIDNSLPPSIGDLSAAVEGTGMDVTLSWTNYNESLSSGGIDKYVVYRSDLPFTNVTDAVAIFTNAAGNKSRHVTGLARQTTNCFAVVAIDRQGLESTNAGSISCMPIDTMAPPNPAQTRFICFDASLTVVWTNVADADGDLAAYEVFVDDVSQGSVVYPDCSYTKTELSPASSYVFRIKSRDLDGNTSTGIVLTGYTLLSNPDDLTVVPYDGYVRLIWNGATPAQNVHSYAVYSSTNSFSNVSGMPRRTATLYTNIPVAGIKNNVTNYFAVTTINKSGGEDTSVTAVGVVTSPDTAGPVLTNLRWQNAALSGCLSSSGTFAVTANDPAMVGRADFYINGALIGSDTRNSSVYSSFWNVYATTNDGEHTLDIHAYDTHGNEAVFTTNVIVELGPLPTPTITSPVHMALLNRTELLLSGVGALYATSVEVRINGVLSTGHQANVNASGTFSAPVDLSNGSNVITVTSVNRKGIGSESAPVTVICDASVPLPPARLTALPRENGVIRLGWVSPPGVSVKGYNIYRSSSSFTETSQATWINPSNIVSLLSYSDYPSNGDGTYYYRLSTINQAGTTSSLSDEVSAASDGTPPAVVAIQYQAQGCSDPGQNRFSRGRMAVDLLTSEPLLTTPFFSLAPENSVPIPVSLSKTDATRYSGWFDITDQTPAGPAWINFSGRDLLNNRGVGLSNGVPSYITIDNRGPSISALVVEPSDPIQNSTSTPVTVSVTVSFESNNVPVSVPELSYSLSLSQTNPAAISLTNLTSTTWCSAFVLSEAAGSNTENLVFHYKGYDDLCNTGANISVKHDFQVYQGDLAPLAPPEDITPRALADGQISLAWSAVEGAVHYVVYKGAASNSLVFHHEADDLIWTENNGNSTDWYAVASVRMANNQWATSTLSRAYEIVADANDPLPPSDLALSLQGKGLEISWQYEAAEPVTFSLYRNTDPYTPPDQLTALSSNISTPNAMDSSPLKGPAYYNVVASDQAGNRSEPSAWAVTNIALLPVGSLHAVRVEGEFPRISWSYAGSGISGFMLYEGEGDDKQLLADALGPNETNYQDIGYSEADRHYSMVAYDPSGASVTRSLTLPSMTALLQTNATLLRGVMNRLKYDVINNSPEVVSNVQLKVGMQSYSYTSAVFAAAACSTSTISLVVGGYSNLNDWIVLTNSLHIAPAIGESATFVGTHELEVGDEVLVGEIVNESFARGAMGRVRFTLHNTSSETIDLLMAGQGTNDSPDVRFRFETVDGMVLSEARANQRMGNGFVGQPDGSAIARFPAGQSIASGEISIPVPTNCPREAVLKLVIDRLHYRYGDPDHICIPGLTTARRISLLETRYTALVTNVSPAISIGSTNIFIQGQALNRVSQNAEPNVPVKIAISLNGFERTRTIYSDAAGNWQYEFTPNALEGGVYKVWAVHPDSLDKPEQASFTVAQLGVRPALFLLDIPRNYEQKCSVQIVSSAGSSFTNLQLKLNAADQPGGVLPVGIHVSTPSAMPVLAGGTPVSLEYSVWADNTAAATGSFVIAVESAEALDGVWSWITNKYTLFDSTPDLRCKPSELDTGVCIDHSITETLIWTNCGFQALEGLEFELLTAGENPEPAPSWIRLDSAPELGELAAGDFCEVFLTIAPPQGVQVNQTHLFMLKATAENYPEMLTPIQVFVASDQKGSLLFKVDDNRSLEGLGSNFIAQIFLQKDALPAFETNVFVVASNVNEALVADLPEGVYSYNISADKHKTVRGYVLVKAGVCTPLEVFLENVFVTIDWSVVSTEIQDRYTIVLSTTFETAVPAPVLVIDPPMSDVPEMAAGDVVYGEFTLKNHGLIRAEQVQMTMPQLPDYKFELLSELPSVLEAEQSVRIPYRITCLSDAQDTGGALYEIVGYSAFACADGFGLYKCKQASGHAGFTTCWRKLIAMHGATDPVTLGWYHYGDDNVPVGHGAASGDGGGGGNRACVPKCMGTCCGAYETVGSVVNIVSGEYLMDETDLSVKASGGMAELVRLYRHRRWYFEPENKSLSFAYGFDTNTIESILCENALFQKTDEQEAVYAYKKSRKILVQTNGYYWTRPSGDWRQYDLNGRMTAYGDRNGARVIYQYDASGKLSGLFDRQTNQLLWLVYSNDLLHSARDQNEGGRQATYEYDSRGNLTNVVNVLGHAVAFGYDQTNRLVYKRLPNGRERIIHYDRDNSVSSVVNGQNIGKVIRYTYGIANKINHILVRTPAGRIKEYFFDWQWAPAGGGDEDQNYAFNPQVESDEDSRPTRIDYPDGTFRLFEYNGPYAQITKEVNEAGVTNLYEYDERGNLTNRIEAAGTPVERTSRIAFDPAGNLLSQTVVGQATNLLTQWTYDAFGNVLTETDSAGQATSNSYDRMGNLLTTADPLDRTWRYAYDAAGRLLTVTDPMNRIVSRNAYDFEGHLTTNIDVLGRATSYQYDIEGNLIKIVDPFGRLETRSYDLDGQLIKVLDAQGKETRLEYDASNRVSRISDSEGLTLSAVYDGRGRLTEVVDGNGRAVSNRYDAVTGLQTVSWYPEFTRQYSYTPRQRLAAVVDRLGARIVTNSYAYDAVGNLIGSTDGEGRSTAWRYDELGRKYQTVDALGQTNALDFDLFDNIVELEDSKDQATRFEYDANRRLVRKTYADESSLRYEYDAAGQLVRRVDAGGRMTCYAYDALGRLATNEYYLSTNALSAQKSVRYSYDDYGRLSTYEDDATQGAYLYDDSNRTLRVEVNYGPFTQAYEYRYDAYGRKIGFCGPDGVTNRYAYNKDKVLSSIDIPGEGAFTYGQYWNDFPEEVMLPGGTTKRFAYDPLFGMVSNRVTDVGENALMDRTYQRNQVGNIVGSGTEEGHFSYAYDPVDQLTNAVSPVLGEERFAYDAAGNRTQSLDLGLGTLDYAANPLNQYTQITNLQSQISLAYDLNGNLTQKVLNGATNDFMWDGENRLAAYSNSAGGASAAYAYDPFGRRIMKTVGGVTTWYLYADEGLIAEIDQAGKVVRTYGYAPDALWNNNTLYLRTLGETSNYYYYLNDHLGAPQKLVGKNGEVVWSASFESFGKATVSTNSTVANNLRFSSQYFDEESGLHYNTYRYYDSDMGRYISRDPIGEILNGGAADEYASGQGWWGGGAAYDELNLFRFCANSSGNAVDFDGLKTCVCRGAIMGDLEVNSLVALVRWNANPKDFNCSRGSRARPEHVWVIWPRGSIDVNAEEWIFKRPEGDNKIRCPAGPVGEFQSFYSQSASKKEYIYLSLCEYDIVAFWDCLKRRSGALKELGSWGDSECQPFADDMVIDYCKKKSRGCTGPNDIRANIHRFGNGSGWSSF